MFKYVLTAVLFLALGSVLATAYETQQHAERFESLTGINWLSFQAAHADCVAHFKEPCKIFGGFAPKSQFRGE